MGIARTIFNSVAGTGVVGVAAWTIATRNARFVPIQANDEIFKDPAYLRNNPFKNPTTQDLCVRRVPLKNIKPQLLEKEGKLAEAFCGSVWGGLGYTYQRYYLEKKYRSDPGTANQLWERRDLQNATYDVGTQITNHFEVVTKTPNSNTVRCGDTPHNTGVRASDGLFQMSADVKEDEGVAEFGLKSVFFVGDKKIDGTSGPMPAHIEFLHRLYTKLWLETAVLRLQK
ncbi:hypothetical protein BJ878DRAFT_539265 [Calycina marina]|uniref:Uncharacterized protein n=1 Tax=Calycina marina TaxID=1763456 RepID=A0A9P7Z8T5_9HELO|nr:hypothetical protein BJ878DRAFT_539265 [Calycina marina]